MSASDINQQSLLRQLPSIDALLTAPQSSELQQQYGRLLTRDALRVVLDEARKSIGRGQLQHSPTIDEVINLAAEWLEVYLAPTLVPVINATGVIVHTNLGRAPLSEPALAAIQAISEGYSNLEYDIVAGERGSRSVHAAELLRQITGAEDAHIVNNNAAAVLLVLSALCQDREVIISRGQLVEIGGGFRVPDVMVQSGARLVEVGTTNRTHLHDYESAITPDTAAIFIAHHSNFQIVGFASEPAIKDIAELAHKHQIPVIFDQGSGALYDVTQFGLGYEPTVPDGLRAGADIVTFSGDKMLGGPQAGLICGDKALIERVRKHPLARAVRPDKTCLAALSVTLAHYQKDEALEKIPVWQMITRSDTSLRKEAESWAAILQAGNVPARTAPGHSTIGGGSLPGSKLNTTLVSIKSRDVDALANRLRQATYPVVARIQENRLVLDPRTVLAKQTQSLLQTVIEVYYEYE